MKFMGLEIEGATSEELNWARAGVHAVMTIVLGLMSGEVDIADIEISDPEYRSVLQLVALGSAALEEVEQLTELYQTEAAKVDELRRMIADLTGCSAPGGAEVLS